ncbi:alpha/beta hydrolase fold protein [Stipitochalara longipes BDJ]|nr:alpha/beta hydrolase fold protein [Stipitochalara longipes BDJ]
MVATDSDSCVHTTAGPVEVEVPGSGTPILILHGSPGGIDAARSMSHFLDKDRFKIICLSRPGHLNTPLSPVNRSIAAEADLLAALLDALRIPRAGVLAWSGGGAAAYQLAARHPHRVSAIVAIAAVSSAWIAPKAHITERIIFGTKLGDRIIKFMSSHSPKHLIEAALEGEGSLRDDELRVLAEQVMADPAQRQLVLEMALTVNVAGGRKEGWQNDVENFASIKSLGLEQIQCPVLLIHGDADSDAPLSYSESAHARLPLSALIVMPRGTHLSFYAHPQALDVQDKAKKWFLDHA